MTQTNCTRIQEDLAWGRELSPEIQQHVVSCDACREIALELSKLQSALDDYIDIEVPSGFADRVMARLEDRSRESIFGFHWDVIRLRLAYLGGVALLLFGFLVPTATGG